jgi:hypothetical protein
VATESLRDLARKICQRNNRELLKQVACETPARIAVKIYSEILDHFLWVLQDSSGIDDLISQGVNDAVYTYAEIRKLKGISPDNLRKIHEAKIIFPMSQIELMEGQNEN